MPEQFQVDQALIRKARAILAGREALYWIIGGSCTGKSTVARRISELMAIESVDMDTYIYERFMPEYRAERHPASKAWFGANHPLAWVMSLPWTDFDALNRASNAEFLDLLADELAEAPEQKPLIIDGGFTHPSVLVQVVSPTKIVCLETPDEMRFNIWETAEDRAFMKQWVHELPDGQAQWQKFLYFDKMMAETMVAESRAAGIIVLERLEETSIAGLARAVMDAFGIVKANNEV